MSDLSLNERTCPNCGGQLIVDEDTLRIECDSCGAVLGSFQQEEGFVDVQYDHSGEVRTITVNTENPARAVKSIIDQANDKVERDRAYADAKQKEENKRSYVTVIVAGIFIIFSLIGLVCLSLYGVRLVRQSHSGKVRMPCSSVEFIGDKYEDVVKVLEKAGFTNVNAAPLDDLVLGLFYSEGEVSEITIDGDNSTFIRGMYYDADAEIVIRYHSRYSSQEEAEKATEKNTNKEDESGTVEESVKSGDKP